MVVTVINPQIKLNWAGTHQSAEEQKKWVQEPSAGHQNHWTSSLLLAAAKSILHHMQLVLKRQEWHGLMISFSWISRPRYHTFRNTCGFIKCLMRTYVCKVLLQYKRNFNNGFHWVSWETKKNLILFASGRWVECSVSVFSSHYCF